MENENEYLREDLRDYKLLRKVFGSRQIDNLLEQARANKGKRRDENGIPYSPVYLKTIHNQLSAMFNHAVRFYGLHENPAAIAGILCKRNPTV